MSRRVKSTYRPKGRGLGRGYPRALLSIEVEEPEEQLTTIKNITPDQERKDEGESAFPGPALEADQQELAEPKASCEHGDSPDVEGKGLPNPEPMKMPEADEGQPQME